MQMIVPWGLIAIIISFFIFYSYNKAARARRNERRDNLKEKRQNYLDAILKAKDENEPEAKGE